MATPTETKSAATAPTAEEKAKVWGNLPPQIQEGISTLNEQIKAHNANVAVVRDASQEKKNPTDTVFELIEKGEFDDKVLKRIATELEEAMSRVETLKSKALARANEIELKPKDVSREAAIAAHESTKNTSKTLREARTGLEQMSVFFGFDLTSFLEDIESTRGLRLTTESGVPQTRPQYKALYIIDDQGNKELISKEFEKNGVKEQRSTTSILAQELTKRGGANFSVNATELTTGFLASQNMGPNDFAKVTAGVEYNWTFTKDAVDSEGKVIGQKTFNLVFVK